MRKLFLFIFLCAKSQKNQPNILFVISDDLGWSDVSWNNNKVHTTPFMKNLVETKGTILKQSYSTHRCTPSRASFLTGRYAFRFGLGSDPITLSNPKGMSLKEKLLPEFLKDAGYDTHAIGKWHLGYCNSSYLPHNRGFDTHYGHYGGSMDYNSHAISGTFQHYINHFMNGEPVHLENYTYATFDWQQRAQEVLAQNPERPKFVYLAFNAPHEKVVAPRELVKKMKELHGRDIASTRLVQMAAVHAIDIAMEQIIGDLEQMERETIVIFHSDNGGSLKAYVGSNVGDPRSCNFPYRGHKNTLFEGGTLSPTFIYSTRRKRFARRKVANMIHITDWFPTILNWANYPGRIPRNLDGLDQRKTFEEMKPEIVRDKFIYGLVNTWDQVKNVWTTQYVVRYGNWKFMNFRREWTQTSKCQEGWENVKHEKFLFPTQPQRTNKMKHIFNIAHNEPFKPSNSTKRYPGFHLFNLKKDPFETRDFGRGPGKRRLPQFILELQNEIQTYVAEEMQKGFEYPITGKLFRGKLIKKIFSKLSESDRMDYFHESGRFNFLTRANMTGYLGTDWCPAETDEELFLEMYQTAIETNQTNLEYFINIQLWDGYGPDGLRVGESRAQMPDEIRFGEDDDSLHSDIWDDDDL